jgi:hypothetical protein
MGDWRVELFPRGEERNRGMEKPEEAAAFCLRLNDSLRMMS